MSLYISRQWSSWWWPGWCNSVWGVSRPTTVRVAEVLRCSTRHPGNWVQVIVRPLPVWPHKASLSPFANEVGRTWNVMGNFQLWKDCCFRMVFLVYGRHSYLRHPLAWAGGSVGDLNQGACPDWLAVALNDPLVLFVSPSPYLREEVWRSCPWHSSLDMWQAWMRLGCKVLWVPWTKRILYLRR